MRHVLRLDELVVGRRVVVRHRLRDGSASDALGDLVEADAERLVVATRRGQVVVARVDVLAAKAVPPPPQRRGAHSSIGSSIGVDALELVAAGHWRPVERVDLGGWQLRAADGFTGRANSALAVGSPGVGLATAIGQVERFYASRGLEAVVAVPHAAGGLGEGTEPSDELARRGWSVRTPTLVMAAAVEDRRAPSSEGPPVRRDDDPDGAWIDAYRGRGVVPAAGRHVLTSVRDRVFASIRDDDGTVLAIARGSLTSGPDGVWLGLAAVETHVAHRRRGLAHRVSSDVVEWGRERGATSAFLQVAVTNAAAVALYERLGFAVHHAYHYRLAPRR